MEEYVVNDSAVWNLAGNPPNGEPGLWTKDLIVVTNLGRVSRLKYFVNDDGASGCWQRPDSFNKSEEVAWWIYVPDSN